ncbi:hypothetical protein BDV25DRAFT_39144 [Aspergillus avenaceus]|uniref:Uncharacterized protein n=1 Tax=Aspergillus avenaceus TaxID=36643 RepID=A0A5N6TM12_ASPAV|nr:hypothetical protein BDV25DRAFT_39144 [Aspergillus avenaceus]
MTVISMLIGFARSTGVSRPTRRDRETERYSQYMDSVVVLFGKDAKILSSEVDSSLLIRSTVPLLTTQPDWILFQCVHEAEEGVGT